MSDDAEIVRMAALKSLNESVHNTFGGMQLANSIILQMMVSAIERQVGPEFRATLIQGLKDTWETSYRATGDDHPMVAQTQEIIQEFINSLEGN